ncbi:hypothetical protein IQ268_21530 [Oculatella sp. LEGE 06141]|uniref:hypothetical protein n=1 Tax=Oculatella sp. LEGE 06141 TaxID=1828648 RepID=UPI00187F5A34|nr:hypothetical protein [Oculatella sp. LEGE 06141]MBE9181146.1 hypothetical protein [Oculatella sp. LEGE 06141]
MSLRNRVALVGVALTTVACLGIPHAAIAQSLVERTDGTQMSQPQLENVTAKVVAVSNDGDIRVRLANGSYRLLPNVNPDVRSRLHPGDQVILTTANNRVLNVALATDDVQQAAAEETVERETIQAQEESEAQTVQSTQTEVRTETTIERQQATQQTITRPAVVQQPVAPAPVRSAPQPVRALW